MKFYISESKESWDSFNSWYMLFAPVYRDTEVFPPHGNGNIDTVIEDVRFWFKEIDDSLEEAAAFDMWEEYKKGSKLLDVQNIDFNDHTNFSVEEKHQILLGVKDLKLLIQQQFNTTAEQQAIVDERLDYLAGAIDRMNKFDWKSILLSTVLSIITTLTLDTEKGAQLFELVRKVFIIIPTITEHTVSGIIT